MSTANVSYQVTPVKVASLPLLNGQASLSTFSKPPYALAPLLLRAFVSQDSQTYDLLALLPVNNPALELSNKSLLTVVSSQIRRQHPANLFLMYTVA